jgi:hypothetical protein
MTTTAGHSFYIGPIVFFYNQVNDTGSWEPLGLTLDRVNTMTCGGSHLGFPIGIKNRGPSNDHSWAVWFQRRRVLKHFSHRVRNSKMTTTAGHSFYIGPIVFFITRWAIQALESLWFLKCLMKDICCLIFHLKLPFPLLKNRQFVFPPITYCFRVKILKSIWSN